MELLLLAKGQYSVVTPESVLEWLAGAPKNMAGHANGFKALFQLYAESGAAKLTEDQFHLAGDGDIYRFRKGNLRVYCFKDENAMVVLTHCAAKYKQKTAKADLKAAQEMRAAYLYAKQNDTLSIIPVTETIK